MSARKYLAGMATAILLGTVASCSRGDAVADTTVTEENVLVGPENVVVVAAREVRTGPVLSGAIEAERQATVRAEIPAAVMETYAEAGQRLLPALPSVPARAVLRRLPWRLRHSLLGARGARRYNDRIAVPEEVPMREWTD